MQEQYQAKYRQRCRDEIVAMNITRTGGDYVPGSRFMFPEGSRGNLDAPEFLPAGCAEREYRCIGAVAWRVS